MGSGHRRLLVTPVVALALYGLIHAVTVVGGDIHFTRAETEVSFWGRGDYQPTANTVHRTAEIMGKLLRVAPHNPDYLSVQANSYAWQAYWAENADTTRQYAGQAVIYQTAALASRPAHLQSRAKLAEYTARLQDSP